MATITQERLKELFHYDPETGAFTYVGADGRGRTDNTGRTLTTNGYVNIGVDYRRYSAHRLAFLYMEGYLPEYVDHINGIRTDNRWENLRAVSKTENSMNASIRTDNASGLAGVRYYGQKGKFEAYINVGGRRKHLGNYETLLDAAAARLSACSELGYSERHGR